MVATYLSLLLASLVPVLTSAYECADHPAIQGIPDFQGVLLKSWGVPYSYVKAKVRAYIPRFSDITFPIVGGSEQIPVGADVVFLKNHDDRGADELTIRFQRSASVYMLVDSPLLNDPIGLPSTDWYPLGWFESSVANPGLSYGMDGVNMDLPDYGFAFKLSAPTDEVSLPSKGDVYNKTKLKNEKSRGFYVILLAESDGSASTEPPAPPGLTAPIPPAGRCPAELHEMWERSYEDFDPTDTSIVGETFKTWHPVVDPCYWCLYDHEHGSDAYSLIGPGFAPRYTYAALKNYNQNEAIEGFKTIVFQDGNYMFAYDFHVQTSQSRRLQTPFHSGTWTVADVSDPANPVLKMRVTQKLNYGPLFIRDDDGKSVPVDNTTEHEIEFAGRMMRRRLVMGPTRNGYEKWATAFMCSEDVYDKKFFSFKTSNPNTRLVNLTAPAAEREAVPITKKGIQQEGIERTFVIRNYEFGEKWCELTGFDLIKSSDTYDGNFYTDPYGHDAYDSPGENRMHQYIEPNFSLRISGKRIYKMSDNWTTLYLAPGNFLSDPIIFDGVDAARN